ncbi:MAG TPA: amino acid deaminase [Microbacteriaceae bacterium]|jgi:hypothetical protein|nr:amino acid deaminase [Microbacteriaceae bacterium]
MMFDQIAADALAGRFGRWGLSTVIDENIDAPVIDRATFERLHEAAGMGSAWPIGNAGLLHVYGYLLSTVATPYGLKRDRWLDGSLARALGLGPEAFLLETASAAGDTVLERVTDAVLPRLEAPHDDALLTFDSAATDGSAVFFRTTVVASPAGAALLYGVHDGTAMRAITAFPLADPSPDLLEALVSAPPRLRYNAATGTLAPRSPLRRR